MHNDSISQHMHLTSSDMVSLRSPREMGREKWDSTSARQRVGLGKASPNCTASLESLRGKRMLSNQNTSQ